MWDPKMLFQTCLCNIHRLKQTCHRRKKTHTQNPLTVFSNSNTQTHDRQKNSQEIISDTRVTEDFWFSSAFQPKKKKTLNLKDLLFRAHLKPPGWQPLLLPVQRVTKGKATKIAHYHATLSCFPDTIQEMWAPVCGRNKQFTGNLPNPLEIRQQDTESNTYWVKHSQKQGPPCLSIHGLPRSLLRTTGCVTGLLH